MYCETGFRKNIEFFLSIMPSWRQRFLYRAKFYSKIIFKSVLVAMTALLDVNNVTIPFVNARWEMERKRGFSLFIFIFRMWLKTKIGTSVWIQTVNVWVDVFTIARMMNGVKLTAFGNSKSKLMIALVRFVASGRFLNLEFRHEKTPYFPHTIYFRKIVKQDVLVTPMSVMFIQPRPLRPHRLTLRQLLSHQKKQFYFCQHLGQVMCQWSLILKAMSMMILYLHMMMTQKYMHPVQQHFMANFGLSVGDIKNNRWL